MREWLAWGRNAGLGALLVLALLFALQGCGDDDDDDGTGFGIQSCEAFTACGGDVVGSWTLTGVCIDGLEDMFADIADQPGCEDFFGAFRASANGEFTFSEDGMASVEGSSFTFQIDVKVTSACVKGLGGANATLDSARCDMMESSQANRDSQSIAGATCSFGGGACNCKVASVPMPLGGNGPYEVQGNDLIQGGDTNPFCVDGDRLTVRTSAGAGTDGTLTLQRK
jgi:hypothetical protein